MAVRLRLTRIGSHKNPIWRVVVADQRSKRDGRVIETVGHYNAQTNPSTIVLDEERIRSWLARGAQPSGTVRKLLRTQGIGSSGSAPASGEDGSSTGSEAAASAEDTPTGSDAAASAEGSTPASTR